MNVEQLLFRTLLAYLASKCHKTQVYVQNRQILSFEDLTNSILSDDFLRVPVPHAIQNISICLVNTAQVSIELVSRWKIFRSGLNIDP